MKKIINDKFIAIADKVSYGMGTPVNILIWIGLVVVWFALGFFLPSLFLAANFLPAWFTSTAWNFPLNTITTLAELYIGFLVAAAANRSERRLHEIIETTEEQVTQIEDIAKDSDQTLKILKRNIDDMQQDLARTHKMLIRIEKQLGIVPPDEIPSEEISALTTN